jgi:2-alkenal reductase
VTTGVLSARRPAVAEPNGSGVLVDAIQTDASINPGNSGGPLLNARGEVIGVNTLARLGAGGAPAGINFAIPINAVKRIIPELIANGVYKHPFLGVGTMEITESIAQQLNLPVQEGLMVQSVTAGTGAATAGLRPATSPQSVRSREVGVGGDIIVAVDGQPVRRSPDLLVYLERNKHPGEIVTLTVVRDGQRLDLPVRVGERPLPQR